MKRLLIANRGEIAIRIMRTAREMGFATIAVYSEPDRDALHVAYADEAYLLGAAAPAQSYLNIERLVEIATRANADAVHPGYGFLAENARFARAVIAAGLTWVGPHPDAIDAMGDKVRARQAMVAAGVPVVPGATVPLGSVDDALAAALEYGLPLALKASGGGGGKGLKIARTLEDIPGAFATARREAEAYFKNPEIYVERYLENPKHVELQILADKHGNVVHVGERDCSLQRRHQKLYEETPANVSQGVRERLRQAGLQAARAIAYDSVGTIETLVSGDDFFFLEMNTRIQVEHTISEMTSGLDLIREQLRVAAGEPLGFTQADVHFRGHAIEIRVNAEDPAQNFRPAPGTITAYREPAGLGVRVDAAAQLGTTISPDYDSMIAKLVVWAPTRETARARLRRAIDEYAIGGVPTTLSFLRDLNEDEHVVDATYGTATLETFAAGWAPRQAETLVPGSSGETAAAPQTMRVEVNDKLFNVRLLDVPLPVPKPGRQAVPRERRPTAARNAARSTTARSNGAQPSGGNDVVSPMHGVVVELPVQQGSEVVQGQVVAIVEAMKMMNEILAPRAGSVGAVHTAVGETVEAQTPLLTLA